MRQFPMNGGFPTNEISLGPVRLARVLVLVDRDALRFVGTCSPVTGLVFVLSPSQWVTSCLLIAHRLGAPS